MDVGPAISGLEIQLRTGCFGVAEPMSGNPFARFEQSRVGLLIPIAIFAVGAIATLVSMALIDRIHWIENRRDVDVMDFIRENHLVAPIPPDESLLPNESLPPNQVEQETK